MTQPKNNFVDRTAMVAVALTWFMLGFLVSVANRMEASGATDTKPGEVIACVVEGIAESVGLH